MQNVKTLDDPYAKAMTWDMNALAYTNIVNKNIIIVWRIAPYIMKEASYY